MAVTTVSTPGLAWIATTLAPCAASLILEVRLHTIEKLFQSLAERRVKKFAGAGAHGGNNCFDPRIGMDRNYLGSLRGVLDPRSQAAYDRETLSVPRRAAREEIRRRRRAWR